MTVESNYVIVIAMLSDWLKRLMPVFQPMRCKTKTNRTICMYVWFSRVLGELQVIARNSDCFMELFVVIGWNNCFVFGFSTVTWKALYPLYKLSSSITKDKHNVLFHHMRATPYNNNDSYSLISVTLYNEGNTIASKSLYQNIILLLKCKTERIMIISKYQVISDTLIFWNPTPWYGIHSALVLKRGDLILVFLQRHKWFEWF